MGSQTMEAKLILVGVLLVAVAFVSAQEGQTGRVRGSLPRRLASASRKGDQDTEQAPSRRNRPAQDDEAVLARRRLLLQNNIRRRRPFSQRKPAEDEEVEKVTERQTLFKQPPKKLQSTLINDIPTVDSPVEKLTNPEIKAAILGEPEIVRVSFKSTETPSTTTSAPTTTTTTTTRKPFFRRFRPALEARRQEENSLPVEDTRQPPQERRFSNTRIGARKFAPTPARSQNRQKAESSQPEEKPVRGGLPARRRITIKKNSSQSENAANRGTPRRISVKGRRRFGRPTPAPTTSTTTTTTTTATTTTTTTVPTKSPFLPLRKEPTATVAPLQLATRKLSDKKADAALEALLRTAAEPEVSTRPAPTLPTVTEALEDVKSARNEEEAALLEMKEDIRNIIPRKQDAQVKQNRIRVTNRARGGLRRPGANTERSQNRFKSFPSQNERQRPRSRVPPVPRRLEQPRTTGGSRAQVNRLPTQEDVQPTSASPVTEAPSVEVSTAISSIGSSVATEAVEISRPTPASRVVASRPTFASRTTQNLPDIPAVFTDLDLPTPTVSFGFSTASENVTPATFFKTPTQPARVSQSVQSNPDRFVFTPRQPAVTPAPQRTSIPARFPTQPARVAPEPVRAAPEPARAAPVPTPQLVTSSQFLENRQSIAALQSNQFAQFDAQFGGAVPFTSQAATQAPVQTQTSSRFGGNRPFPQQRLLPTVNRVAPQPTGQTNQNVVFGTQFGTQRTQFRQPTRVQSVPTFASNQPIRAQNQQTFASQQPVAVQTQQTFSSAPAFSSQAAAPSQQTFINLPSGTFTGHPAQDININTGTFSLSTGL